MSKYLIAAEASEGFILTDVSFALSWLIGKRNVSHDSETTGLDYFKPSSEFLLLWQFGDDVDQFVVDLRYQDLGFLIPHFKDKDVKKFFHHRSFDLNVAATYFNESFKIENAHDTEIMSRNLHCGKDYTHTMVQCAMRELGIAVDKGQRQTFVGHTGTFTSSQLHYAAEDIRITHLLAKSLWGKLKENNSLKSYQLDLDVEDWRMTRNGMGFDTAMWLELYEKNKIFHRQLLGKLDLFIKDKLPHIYKPLCISEPIWGTDGYSRYLGSPIKGETYFNWDSSTQILKHIFKPLKLDPKDKDGKASVGKDAIEMLVLVTPPGIERDFLKLYLEYCKSKNAVTTFGEDYLYQSAKSHKEVRYEEDLFGNKVEITSSWEEEARPTVNPITGRIHPYINPVLNTGRFAMSRPNLSQVPAKDSFRSCFRPQEGKLISAGDFAGQEDKIMAVNSKDHEKINFIIYDHGDTHSYTASKMFSAQYGYEVIVPPKVDIEHLDPEGFKRWNDSPHKALRHKGKILNLSLAFGSSAYTLAKTLGIPIEEAEVLFNAYWGVFPKLDAYFKSLKAFGLEHGYVRFNEVTNRVRYFPEWDEYKFLKEKADWYYKEYGKEARIHIKQNEPGLNSALSRVKGKIERAAGNTPVQGTASDMIKTAIANLNREADRYNSLHDSDIKVVLAVHDEIECEFSQEYQTAAEAIHKSSMEDAFKLFCWDKGVENIPINVFIQSKPHWFK
jgi:DNA polymerase I-like protein with 3'-5' exonuclease and polymerase domains